MDFNDFSNPTLVEPGIKYFLDQTLQQCHIFKENYYNTLFNIGLFIFLIFILALILLYKYKGKLTPLEQDKKNKEQQQYILSKIKMVQENKKRVQQELITGLPEW